MRRCFGGLHDRLVNFLSLQRSFASGALIQISQCVLFSRRFLSEHGKIRCSFFWCTLTIDSLKIISFIHSHPKSIYLKGKWILGQYILHCGTFELLMKVITIIHTNCACNTWRCFGFRIERKGTVYSCTNCYTYLSQLPSSFIDASDVSMKGAPAIVEDADPVS